MDVADDRTPHSGCPWNRELESKSLTLSGQLKKSEYPREPNMRSLMPVVVGSQSLAAFRYFFRCFRFLLCAIDFRVWVYSASCRDGFMS